MGSCPTLEEEFPVLWCYSGHQSHDNGTLGSVEWVNESRIALHDERKIIPMSIRLARYAGWAAFLTGVMSIFGFVTIVLFFALEAPQIGTPAEGAHIWGPLSDMAGPLTMIPLIVVMFALHWIERESAHIFSRVVALIGVGGALAANVLQVLLIAKFLSFEQEVGPVVVAMGIVGLWLLLANYLAWIQHILPSGLACLGIVVGVSQVLYPVLFQVLGGTNFYANIGSDYWLMTFTGLVLLVSYVGFPAWAIWLGRVWSNRRKPSKAEVVYAG